MPAPGKSGVLGLLLCAMGVSREESAKALTPLVALAMGVRVDRPGTMEWDYHTAGAKIGIRSADGKIKRTQATGEYETLLSRRQYLYDASFLVALQGEPATIDRCVRFLHGPDGPVWPVFLGRKCCIPGEPVYSAVGAFGSVSEALSSVPWQPRIAADDWGDSETKRTLDTLVEHPEGSAPPEGARLVYDVPRGFGFNNHGSRWVIAAKVSVAVGEPVFPVPILPTRSDPYGPEWDALRQVRLETDNYLCVFCKSPAVEVHHLDYEDVRPDTLRSLCKTCHDACTILEYGTGKFRYRIDPSDPVMRPAMLKQIDLLLTERRMGRRRELLEAGRGVGPDFFDKMPSSWTPEGR